MRGKFIVVEGIDGSGKTTQINKLKQWLIKTDLIPKNNQLVITREPGGTMLGESIRSLLLDTSKETSPSYITELLLYAADRSQHIDEIIRPSLEKGDWVISDRFCGSTLAYQGYGRKLNLQLIKDLEVIATQGILPDLTFLLEISVNESIKRRRTQKDDRIEKEGKEFLTNVALGFHELSKKNNWIQLSAMKSEQEVTSEMKYEIRKLLQK